MERDRGQGSPEGAPKNQQSAPPKEQGRGEKESKERQALPSIWDILEREVRLDALDIKDHPRAGSEEYRREMLEISRLQEEMEERGTPRDQLISDLFYELTSEPTGTFPIPSNTIYLSLEEFRQFRSKVEPISDDELREEIRKAKEEYKHKEDEIDRKERKAGADRYLA